MFNLRIRSMLLLLGAIVCIAFAAIIEMGRYAASNTAVYGSGHYNAIIRAKDLVADVLPPPAYLIESYLEATLATKDPAHLSGHAQRLVDLHRQYNERLAYWSDASGWKSEHGFNEPLYNLVVRDSNAEAEQFWTTVERELLPAIVAHNPEQIDSAFVALTAAYTAHRQKVDQIVKGAQEELAHLESAAAEDNAFVEVADLSIIGFAIIFTITGFFFIFRRVVKPVGEVTGVMTKLASGDLNAKADGAGRKDEIGYMVRALEVFRENLLETDRLRAEQAQTAANAETARRESLREMAVTVESEAGSAVAHVSQQAGAMARLAEDMAGSVSNVTDQCQGVAAAAQQALMSATSVTAATHQFSASIREVSQQLTHARSVTAATVDTSERTRLAVANLAEAVDRIGSVANIISEIADQTNLLALNATIEAARAGDAGRGFAVVASEVKSLSSQTARSTEEIRRHVSSIQVVMRETTDVVAEIARQIASVDEGSMVIAAAMEEQSATINEIARHVEETARAASYVSDSVGVVLSEAAKTGEGARSLSSTVGDVDESIARLRETIVRVVRTASPDVERRKDPRFDVNVAGELVDTKTRVTVENLSRGGALLGKDADLRNGEAGRLRVADTQVPFKVLRKDKSGTHLQFETGAQAVAEQALNRLASTEPTRKVK